jgi:type I restriction enzyme S subunit
MSEVAEAVAVKHVPLSEAAEINPKVDRTLLEDHTLVSFVPMAAVGAADGQIDVSTTRPYAEVKKGYTAFRNGDVLFAKVTPCMENGKMAVARNLSNGQGFGSTEFHVLRPREGVDSSYLYHFVSSASFRKEAARHMTGAVGLRRVPSAFLQDELIPLPELAEQRRIVAEIEKQFSRLDEAVANLQRVKANLKRYKAAILKAAVEGRLVETEATLAHREGRSYETGEQLLQRILDARRALAKGRRISVNEADQEGFSACPSGWIWATCDAAIQSIDAGASFKCEERPPGRGEVGVLKVSALTWGVYDEAESKTCKDADRIEEKFLVRDGDFLFSRANTIELVGACVIVGKTRKQLMLSDKTLRFDVCPQVSPVWLQICLRCKFGRDEIERLATGNQESMRNIGQERIRQIRMPLPPFAEQVRIVAEVDRLFSVIREVEAEVDANLQRARGLRQSILTRSFG